MDNSSGGGTPARPRPTAVSDPAAPEAQFTVPVPTYSTPTQSRPLQSRPLQSPPPTGTPWHPAVPAPQPAHPVESSTTIAYAASPPPAEGPSDAESLRNLAHVLLGIALGFWVLVGIRMLARLVELGPSSRLLIETIDQTAVETVAAALISVLAVASAVASRVAAGRGASAGLVWGAAALAACTVVAAIWRLT